MENEELKSVTESLYKQNLELAVKNKTLSLLSKLYEISVLTLNTRDLAKKVTLAIQVDLSFELVGVLLFSEEKDELIPLAFSESDRFYQTQSNLNVFSISIPDISKSNFLKKVVEGKTMAYTEELSEIWDNLISKETTIAKQMETKVKAIVQTYQQCLINNKMHY